MSANSGRMSDDRIRTSGLGRAKRLDMVLEVPVHSINREDHRFQFRIGSSAIEIENSIRSLGQQVPVTLWGREPYIIIDGFRRVRALAALDRPSVRAILRDDLDEHGAYQLSFVENAKRRSWTPFERALAVRVAIVDRGLSIRQVASELTLSERQVQRYLQMADFDPKVADALSRGCISMAHAAVLHSAKAESVEPLLAEAERLSVAALKRKLRPRQRGRPRSYLSISGSGFRLSAFQFNPSLPPDEKQRMLAALERALEVVRASLFC